MLGAPLLYAFYSKKQKKHPFGCFIFGGGTEIRTLDPMIKSHLLYQLSYASKTELFHKVRGTFCHKKNKKSRKKYIFVKNISNKKNNTQKNKKPPFSLGGFIIKRLFNLCRFLSGLGNFANMFS